MKDDSTIPYQPYLDGIRAIAVTIVVLYHFDISGFTGGFVGVDIFFVLSGYLITSLCCKEIKNNSFSLWVFFKKRLKRIYPAYIATIFLCIILALFIFLPNQLNSVAEYSVASVFFLSNIFFWSRQNYFAESQDPSPLLHTWSLGVEAQFYLLFPLAIIAITKLNRLTAISILGLVSIISLGWSEWQVSSHAPTAFFLAPYRLWEFTAGAVIAFAPPFRVGALGADLMIACGLVLVTIASYCYSGETTFPGVSALIPCFAAILMILGNNRNGRLNRLLSSPTFEISGKISYSIYLIHWPLYTFSKYMFLRELHINEKLIFIFATYVLAFVSWRWIELPFRYSHKRPRRKWNAIILMVAGFATIALAVVIVAFNGMPSRFPQPVLELAQAGGDINPLRRQCLDIPPARLEEEICRTGAMGVTPSFLWWGDSHADAMTSAIHEATRRSGHSGLIASRAGCPPIIGVYRIDKPQYPCAAFSEAAMRLLKNNSNITDVIMVAWWTGYKTGNRIALTPDAIRGEESTNEAFVKGLKETISFLKQIGKTVHIMAPVPAAKQNPSIYLARAIAMGRSNYDIRFTLDEYLGKNEFILKAFRNASDAYNVNVIYPHKFICNNQYCEIFKNGVPLYYDGGHMSNAGAREVWEIFAGIFDDAVPKQ